jgi:hypothetical protein
MLESHGIHTTSLVNRNFALQTQANGMFKIVELEMLASTNLSKPLNSSSLKRDCTKPYVLKYSKVGQPLRRFIRKQVQRRPLNEILSK